MASEMLRVAICDDVEEDLLRIKEVLRAETQILSAAVQIKVWTFTSGEALYQSMSEEKYDLVFLDIEMPDWDGFRLAGMLHRQCPESCIVFVSNHESMVFDSMDYMPLGFVRKGHLERDMEHVVSRYFRMTASRRISYKIKDGFSYKELLLKDILYVECTGHEISFVMASGQGCYRTHGSLKAIETDLAPHDFLRVHKNYLVNQRYVEDVERREVLLTNGQRVDMGKDRRKAVKDAMLCYGRKHHGIKWISG